MSKKHIKPLTLAEYEERKAIFLSCKRFEEMVIFDRIEMMHRNPEERVPSAVFCVEVFSRLGWNVEESLLREIARTMNYNIDAFLAHYRLIAENHDKKAWSYLTARHDRWWQWLDELEREWANTKQTTPEQLHVAFDPASTIPGDDHTAISTVIIEAPPHPDLTVEEFIRDKLVGKELKQYSEEDNDDRIILITEVEVRFPLAGGPYWQIIGIATKIKETDCPDGEYLSYALSTDELIELLELGKVEQDFHDPNDPARVINKDIYTITPHVPQWQRK